MSQIPGKFVVMDIEMVNKGLRYAHKRKKWILLITALGFTTYGAYRVCKSPSVIKKRDRAMKILGAIASITECLGDSAETIGVISKDLKEFIQSDTDQIPCSVKQLLKITSSDEFSDSIVRVTRALTMGIIRGYRIDNKKGDSASSFSDRALDKLLSPTGCGFASIVVGSFARNMVIAMYTDRSNTTNSIDNGSKWFDVIADDKCKKLIGDCIQRFVTTMVTVYLDKTTDMNPYDEILSSLTNPKHEGKVRDLLALICNGAIETFVKTSHQVLTNTKSNNNSDSNATSSSSYLLRKSSSTISKVFNGQELMMSKLNVIRNPGSRLLSNMSSALAAPGNMRFVLDVTGRVTLATIKSFLQFSVNRVSEGTRRKCQKLVDYGRKVYKYLTAKYLVVVTICVSVYLHMLSGPWTLVAV